MDIRFGITMRITHAQGYNEPRDTIARDWSNYIMDAFPKSKYLFIPNIGEKAVDFIKKWKINMLVISGGDDLGVTPERDVTENGLLRYAIETNIPIIAICRGIQLVHSFYGGKLIRGNESFVKTHRANKHNVKINNSIEEVNSFHTNRIDEKTLNKRFNIFARCTNDNSIEGIEGNQILAMMWHPERDKGVSSWNKLLIENFIKKNI